MVDEIFCAFAYGRQPNCGSLLPMQIGGREVAMGEKILIIQGIGSCKSLDKRINDLGASQGKYWVALHLMAKVP